jgi:hypothetical protein
MPRRFRQMKTGADFFISDMAVRIVSTRGVWLDPEAAVSNSQNQKTPVRIYVTAKGYTVELSSTQVWLKKFWVISMTDFFANQGFIPSTGVNIRGQRNCRHVVGEGNSPARGVHQKSRSTWWT